MLHQRLFPSEDKTEINHTSHKKSKNKKDVVKEPKATDIKKETKSTEDTEFITIDCKQ